MQKRFNVCEDERRCFSRRALTAISALRNAGLDTGAVAHGKDHIPGRRGRWYSLVAPDKRVCFFSRLADIIAYAEDYRLYTTTMLVLEKDERISWQRWQADGTAYALSLLVPQLRAIARTALKPAPAHCAWSDCQENGSYALAGDVYCEPHYYVAAAMLRERTA